MLWAEGGLRCSFPSPARGVSSFCAGKHCLTRDGKCRQHHFGAHTTCCTGRAAGMRPAPRAPRALQGVFNQKEGTKNGDLSTDLLWGDGPPHFQPRFLRDTKPACTINNPWQEAVTDFTNMETSEGKSNCTICRSCHNNSAAILFSLKINSTTAQPSLLEP